MAENDLELDLSKIGFSKEKTIKFFKKYGIFFLIIIPVILSAYIRLIPADMPIANDWAKSTVDNYYKNQIRDQIKQQYPNLPDQNLNTLVDQQFSEFYKQNKEQIKQQIIGNANQIKEQFQDSNGYFYMPDIDPYTSLRYAENYLETGHVGDEVKDGIEWDNHMIAPKGTGATSRPHPLVLAYLYKVMHAFNPKITIMQSSTYFPVIFAALSVIPIFFIARMFAGNVGGFFAAIMMAVNGAFLGRTSWGHADTDAYTIFFAAYFIWFFFLAIKEANIKKLTIYSSLAGLSLGLFGLFWTGWWYVFAFALGTMFFYVLYLLIFEIKTMSFSVIKENHHFKQLIKSYIFIIIASLLFVSIFTSPTQILSPLTEPFVFTKIKEASHATLWPNVYTTVAEMNQASIKSIIDSVGGNMFFYLSLIGIVFLLFYKTDNKRPYIQYAIIMILWYIGIIYASGKGVRFTMMLVPALSLAFGALVGILYKKGAEYMEGIKIPPVITKTAIIIIFFIILFPYIKGNAQGVKSDIPMINDAWFESLNKIKLESEPNAIINSWWDFGHHFKYFADRAVTFDGASQNYPMAHWIGKVLLTSNEKEAIGILRMLDCGSTDAFEILNAELNNAHKSVDMLYDIVVMDKSQAESYLEGKVLKETAAKVIQNTHCSPPEDYFITSEDMVGKAGVWAHFGSWDFNKADIWVNTKGLPKEESIAYIKNAMKVSDEEAKNVYFKIMSITDENNANSWISPWPGYGETIGCSKENNNLLCGGVLINLTTKDVQINTNEGIKSPYSLVYSENNELIEKKFEGGLQQSILLINEGESYRITIVSTQLATSMFTKLFYYDGAGTQQFIKFSDQTSIIGERIIVWKIKW